MRKERNMVSSCNSFVFNRSKFAYEPKFFRCSYFFLLKVWIMNNQFSWIFDFLCTSRVSKSPAKKISAAVLFHGQVTQRVDPFTQEWIESFAITSYFELSSTVVQLKMYDLALLTASVFSLVFSTTGKRGFQTGRAAVAAYIMSASKRFQAVTSSITGGKFYRLPPEKENTATCTALLMLLILAVCRWSLPVAHWLEHQ